MAKKETKEGEKNKGGRPTDYKEEYTDLAYKFCLLGATDKELADLFSVCEKTINNWKKDYPEFLQSVTCGKTIADAEVAAAFHKRAKGYEFEEKTYEGGVLTKTVTKEMAPDPGAALNWLKNRQPTKWRDSKNIDVTSQGESVNKPDLKNLSIEELELLKKLKGGE